MSSYATSSSDQNILNALTICDDIKEFVSYSSFENSGNVFYESGYSERTSSVTSATNYSSQSKGGFDNGKEACDSLKFYTECQTASQSIGASYFMKDSFIERKNALENATKTFVNEAESSSKEILCKSILERKLESIDLVGKHILQIANQMSRIKKALQDDPGKSALKVSPCYLEGAVQFFDTVDSIIKKMLENVDAIEFSDRNVFKVFPIDETALQSNLENIIRGLARRLDILTDFRNSLLTTEELEPGIDLGISETGKSEPPRLIFEQISTADSGLTSSLNTE